MDVFVREVARGVAEAVGASADEVASLLQPPKDSARGDLALPCFKLAQSLGRQGKDAATGLAGEIAARAVGGLVLEAEAAGPFVNFRLDPTAVARAVLTGVWTSPSWAGGEDGRGKTVVIDFSSPNIAKPFHLGHLRSTVIGWSLRQIYRALGYTVVGVNHLGDWGTQFGLMIAAWQRWHEEAERRIAAGERDIEVFVDLYQRINRLAEEDPAARDEGREWFRRLEQGDAEARRLWTFFVERSKSEFARIYEMLGIVHESDAGEAFYNDKMDATVTRLRQAGLLVPGMTRKESAEERVELARRKLEAARAELETGRAELAALEGKKADKLRGRLERTEAGLPKLEAELAEARQAVPAEDDGLRPLGVDLSKDGLGFCMLLKVDGSTTYTTRDLTAALYRARTYQPEKVLYVVGNEQRDHFLPWFRVIELLGEPCARGLVHVGFGKYLGMSTRRGTAVFLEEVLERARERAFAEAERSTKKVELSDAERERVARAIGIAAVKFFDLKAERTKDIDLSRPEGGIDWDRLLDLKGDSGPYLVYAHARLAGILRRVGAEPDPGADPALLGEPEARSLIKTLAEFPGAVRQAAEKYEPSVVSRYLLELAQKVHVFIHHHRVLDAVPSAEQAASGVSSARLQAARVLLVACAKKVMAEALDLLGIEALEQM